MNRRGLIGAAAGIAGLTLAITGCQAGITQASAPSSSPTAQASATSTKQSTTAGTSATSGRGNTQAAGASTAPSGGTGSGAGTAPTAPTMFDSSGQSGTYNCAGESITVTGGDANLVLLGTCSSVSVTGADNKVTVAAAQQILVTGSDNKVVWVNPPTPTIENGGTNNSVVHGSLPAGVSSSGGNGSTTGVGSIPGLGALGESCPVSGAAFQAATGVSATVTGSSVGSYLQCTFTTSSQTVSLEEIPLSGADAVGVQQALALYVTSQDRAASQVGGVGQAAYADSSYQGGPVLWVMDNSHLYQYKVGAGPIGLTQLETLASDTLSELPS